MPMRHMLGKQITVDKNYDKRDPFNIYILLAQEL